MYRGIGEFKVYDCAAERIFSKEDLEKYKNSDSDLIKLYNLINKVFPEESLKIIGS